VPENEIRVWAVVDANGNPLYSSNDRIAVEADLERRVATDQRLRRVLRIAEHTLTFPPRDDPVEEPGEAQTVCVLPWLPLDEPVRMGPLMFDHWSELRELAPEPARATTDQLLGNFWDIYGNQVDPAICFFADRAPTARLSHDERDYVRTQTFLLALAGLGENTYMHPAFEPMNAAHARRLFINFHASSPEIHAVRRRREGWAQSHWRSTGLKIFKPFAAEARPTAAGEHPLMTLYRQQFVDSLAACAGATDPLSRAVTQAVVPFLRANDMDEYGGVEQDIVWLVTTFEQLVGKALQLQTGRRGSDLPVRIADLFADHWQRQERTNCRRWLEDLRRTRNELHGQPSDAARWRPWAHALLATELFPLAVKALLARAERYILDSWDSTKIEAFPSRVVLLEGDGPFDETAVGEAWHQSIADAAERRVRRTGNE
jgi:hypothetical protein